MRKNAREKRRQIIIEIAWRLIAERGVDNLTLAEVAKRAGLSRQAVYWHMKNRTGLLTEVARYNDLRQPEAAIIRTGLPDADPIASVETVLHAWCAALPRIAPIHLAIEAAASSDADARIAYDARLAVQHRVIRRHITRLAESDLLAHGLSVDAAAEIMMAHGSPAAWRLLTEHLGWSPKQFEAHLLTIQRKVIIRSLEK